MYGRLRPHEDSGDIERLIHMARQRLAMGLSAEDTIASLVDKGVGKGAAFNATIAAAILNKDVGR